MSPPTVVVCPYNVANFPDGGGHFWVYLQYVLGLRDCGCDVWWLERFVRGPSPAVDREKLAVFRERMRAWGLDHRHVLYLTRDKSGRFDDDDTEVAGLDRDGAETLFRGADLLVNFHYAMAPELLARFSRRVLVDIDPGLLQFWLERGQIVVHPHHAYFTTAETVGAPGSPIGDAGLEWFHIHPPVSLEHWARASDPTPGPFTAVSTWDAREWIADGPTVYENTKRIGFLRYIGLPALTDQPLELALWMRTERDREERLRLERMGWRVRSSREVAATPDDYRAYVRSSGAEFGWAKPFHVRNRTAWVSDRTVCYLASGRPVVVRDTGPSRYLPNGEGMFRFSTLEQAAWSIESVLADYPRHARAARALAEHCFDARRQLETLLAVACDRRPAAVRV